MSASFDPDLEDAHEWECQLKGIPIVGAFRSLSIPRAEIRYPIDTLNLDNQAEIPAEYDDEELATYAKEYGEYFDNLPDHDDEFDHGDWGDTTGAEPETPGKGKGKAVAMDPNDDGAMPM